jgi:hypothetical protein
MATLDGQAIFGVAVGIVMTPHASAEQTSQYFGVNGQQALWGGTRGRTFQIDGVLNADVPADILAAAGIVSSFDDGNAHVLVDNAGVTWPNVVFRGEITLDRKILILQDGSVGRAYHATFYGLS